ncbi:uncharacterized protein LOC127556690 isoform X2 [Antechinus flavipes]|uniref:uncharacterized protein LOC127556690 isoform X2 n=1 Tax=Antechinus flavipes TaxID=38775 RepID=UPI0022366F8D|nr:uncharacterized protein LOC127556690 isoform X2 [Antechinus flavipes]
MPTGSAAAGMTPSTGAKHQQPPPLPHSTSATAAARPPARCRRRSTTTTPVPLPAASIPRRCSCHRCRHGESEKTSTSGVVELAKDTKGRRWGGFPSSLLLFSRENLRGPEHLRMKAIEWDLCPGFSPDLGNAARGWPRFGHLRYSIGFSGDLLATRWMCNFFF